MYMYVYMYVYIIRVSFGSMQLNLKWSYIIYNNLSFNIRYTQCDSIKVSN